MRMIKVKKSLLILSVLIHFSFLAQAQPEAGKPKLIIPYGHQSGILHTLFSHDYKLIITADEKITIISDVRSGKPLYYLNGTNPAISANDGYISTVADTLVMLWNAANGELLNVLKVNTNAISTSFNPVSKMLLVQKMTDGDRKDNNEQNYIVALWDYGNNRVLHEFNANQQEKSGSGDCNECSGGGCPIYGAWFNAEGDSLRLINKNLVKTYSLSNFNVASLACFKLPGNGYLNGSIKILNNNTIKVDQSDVVYCFNEYGQYVATWQVPSQQVNFGVQSENESISPAFNFQATYTSSLITFRDLKGKTSRLYEVEGGGIKKLMFNQAGTHILVEYLNDAPRIFSTINFSEPSGISPTDYSGFPAYVYETKTEPDVVSATAVFDSVEAKLPPTSKAEKRLSSILAVPSREKIMKDVTSGIKNDVKNTYTNSGVIINLANNRTISKIQSLIKPSGDIKLSPNGKIMLLNTGKLISIYSIPYAKILINLKGGNTVNSVFSPDSRWLVQYNAGAKATIINLVTGEVKNIELKMPVTRQYTIEFFADSKRFTIFSSDGGYAVMDIGLGKVIKLMQTKVKFYSPAYGNKYGTVNEEEHIARVFSKKDSALLFTLDLTTKPKGKNKKPSYSYKISFSETDAIALWNAKSLIYVKDINMPADTTRFDNDDNSSVTGLTLSPNGKFASFQTSEKISGILNCMNFENSFSVSGEIPEEQQEIQNVGSMVGKNLKAMMSGNMEEFIGGREIVQFSETGDSVMVCNHDSAVIFLCANGSRLSGYRLNGEIKYFNFKKHLFIAYYYGQLKFYTVPEKEWFSMIPFNNGETVFLLPGGAYFGNKSVTRYLGYMYDAKSLSYKQFDYNNNRPDIVLRDLGNTDKKYLAIYDSTLAIRRRREGLKDVKAINFDKAPEVVITNEKEIKGEVKQKELSLNLAIKGAGQYPDRLAVFINGNPIGNTKGIRLSRKGYTLDTTLRLTLTEGNNNIEVSVFDAAGAESYRQPLYIQYSPDTTIVKNVYFAGVGAAKYSTAGKNLLWAKSDIVDVLDSLKSHYGSNVIVDTLFNTQVTLENFKKLKTKFSRSRPDDIVIVYYSGHGKIDMNKAEAFFGTYDMDFNSPSKKGISIKDFTDLMDNIPARNKAIFLDACHSGEINKDALLQVQASKTINTQVIKQVPTTSDSALANLTKGDDVVIRNPGETDPFDIVLELFTDLYQNNGSNIIVAARGLEAAKECDQIEHGVFTYAVMNGISQMTADEDSNAVLSIGELQNYVTRNVSIFSTICEPNKVQRAATRKENEYNDWAILGSTNGGDLKRRSTVREVHEKKSLAAQSAEIKEVMNTGDPRAILKGGGSSDEKAERLGDAFDLAKNKLNKFFKKSPDQTLKDYQGKNHPKAISLINESGLTVTYELIKNNVIFNIACAGYVPSIRVDANSNGKADQCDKVYTKDEINSSLCISYVLDEEHVATCGFNQPDCSKQKSAASILITGDQYLFLVPAAEISDGKKGLVNFSFYGIDKKISTIYPTQEAGKMFGKTMEIVF